RAPTQRPRARRDMKAEIHPAYVETQVTGTCGTSVTTRSTKSDGVISTEVCSACHPFYTGKEKSLDTGARVDRVQARYGRTSSSAEPLGSARRRARELSPTPVRAPGRAPASSHVSIVPRASTEEPGG